ncbi:hypothetical protein AJ85_14945 [Alkalihalobacillus alcalophilus ATCC 27647 = CGMCC 1.3604]|uniref:OmpA-like domain-containing protein n=1 Tax=Alkalihalobacillus alcalophilus ATCC 27647 = CGMCC 1.3604 TaxID=1218173 RepID=A0A4S4K1E0_ALKAL|nr:OmpA family protein [Alkalihalobacillus alcalophilus]MED1560699.1 OmpA family protein [Alkalihalobacillus alcalophilus]THG89799.1 hypothetical protein AJ85_14945 [Alkalihalobacillus alcalophilus ATCC 27647 = CGMCC 1.3604]
MKRNYFIFISFLMALALILVACTNKVDKSDESVWTNEAEDEVVAEQLNESEEIGNDLTFDGEVFIEGVLKVDASTMRIEAASNLLPGTKVKVDKYMEPFRNRLVMGMLTNDDTEVKEDGTIIVEMERPSEFQNGKYIEITLEVTSQSQVNEISEVYGENGENLTGAHIYQSESFDGEVSKKVFVPIYVLLDGNEIEVEFSTPERAEKPVDYGETELWFDYELTNDHRFYYVRGKMNLIEGAEIQGGYFSSPAAVTPQFTYMNKTKVQPDGTFLLRIQYSSKRPEGYIQIMSGPNMTHELKKAMKDVYGENYENISGELVEEGDNGSKRIYMELYPEPPEIEVPEETNLTSDEEEIKVAMPDDVLFDYDSHELKLDSTSTLDDIVTILNGLESSTIIHIDGHTDSQGDADYNIDLSERRAQSVKEYLSENGDIGHLNITINGYGETRPIESNDDESGRKKNRRVEIIINPKN